MHNQEVDVAELTKQLSGDLAAEYVARTPKTLSRDINTLESLEWVIRNGRKVRSRKEVILAFLPVRARA